MDQVSEARPKRQRLAAALIGASGAALVAGSFLTWSAFSLARGHKGKGGKTGTLTGLQLLDGKLVLAAGIGLVVLAALVFLLRQRPVKLGATAVAIGLGVVSLALALSSLGSTFGSALGAIKPHLAERIQSSWGPGFFVALGGSTLAILAGSFGLLSADRAAKG
jgi:hypothetical protein